MTFVRTLEGWISAIGRFFAWGALVLIFLIVLQVVLRYGFGKGLIILEELQWHLYGIGILMGLAYTTIYDAHVRVDLFYERVGDRPRCVIELLGTVFLLWPFILVVFYHSIPFFLESYHLGEGSDAPAGLPYRWVIKAFIPAGFVMLFLATLTRFLRALLFLLKPSDG